MANTFQLFFPCAELKPFVRYYSTYQTNAEENHPVLHALLPMTLPALNFLSTEQAFFYRYRHRPFVPGQPTLVIGQLSQTVYGQFRGNTAGLLVVFTPWGLYRIFGLNMIEFRDRLVDGLLCIGNNVLACRQRLFSTDKLHQRIQVVETFLLSCLHNGNIELRDIDNIIQMIQLRKGNVAVALLCKQANMSLKTFERHFDQKAGLPPKLFSEITRFAHAVRMFEQNKNAFEIIVACGYADQAHLIKEFKKFSNTTPTQFYPVEEKMAGYFFSSR